MDWLASNWLWIVLIGGMFGMHVFGHGHGDLKGDGHGAAKRGERRTGGRD